MSYQLCSKTSTDETLLLCTSLCMLLELDMRQSYNSTLDAHHLVRVLLDLQSEISRVDYIG